MTETLVERKQFHMKLADVFRCRVREVLLDRQLSQNALAKAAGMFPSSLARVMSGAQEPSIETIERVAQALDLPPADLMQPSKRRQGKKRGHHNDHGKSHSN